ncbi:hypothetical protein KUTeg_000473 [Tegillarca granosa]|uniref:Major facilitator superfamily (MFS) profile domain-containing protein n=1 Tax=Tegillarca granosa TaxID=220873 RepID=A0ABQ9G121_TEGGR|nr:hypothetical protein KUTeg_000473 [Tegillarca granosa]
MTPDSEFSSSDKSTNQDSHIENLYKERPIDNEFTKVDENIKCGCGNWKPDFLQLCNNPKWLLTCLCIFSMLQGFVVNGINNVNTSTIERRFQLPSSRVGAISSSYDVSAAILGIIISYLGSGKHKPRMVAMAAVTMAIGSFVMTLPHFITGVYEAGQNVAEVCSATDDSAHRSVHCSDSENHLSSYLYVLLLGQALHGIGGTTLYIVGISLLDDSVTSSTSPLYVGILYAFATLGPALGYIIGGRLLDVYVDFHEPNSNR